MFTFKISDYLTIFKANKKTNEKFDKNIEIRTLKNDVKIVFQSEIANCIFDDKKYIINYIILNKYLLIDYLSLNKFNFLELFNYK